MDALNRAAFCPGVGPAGPCLRNTAGPGGWGGRPGPARRGGPGNTAGRGGWWGGPMPRGRVSTGLQREFWRRMARHESLRDLGTDPVAFLGPDWNDWLSEDSGYDEEE